MSILAGIIAGISAIAAAVAPVVHGLATVGLAITGLKAIGSAVVGVAKTLGIVPEKTTVEELGDKSLQMEQDGITPENFDSYKAYIQEAESYQLNPERSKKFTAEEKVLKGTEIATGAIMEKNPDSRLLDVLDLVKSGFIAPTVKGFDKIVDGLINMTNEAPEKVGKICDAIKGIDNSVDTISSALDSLDSLGKKLGLDNVSDILK